jgi:antitoxin CptB
MTCKDEKVKRLIYQSWHRGCKETDLILGKFAKQNLANLSDEELSLYEEFIEENDWDIYAWITKKSPLPEKYHHPLIDRIMSFNIVDDAVV